MAKPAMANSVISFLLVSLVAGMVSHGGYEPLEIDLGSRGKVDNARVFRVVGSDFCLASWDDAWIGTSYQGAPCMRSSQQWNPFCWKEPEANCLALTGLQLWYIDGACSPPAPCKFKISVWVETTDPCVGRTGLNCASPPCCTAGYSVPDTGQHLGMGTFTLVEREWSFSCTTVGGQFIALTIQCDDNDNMTFNPARIVRCGGCD